MSTVSSKGAIDLVRTHLLEKIKKWSRTAECEPSPLAGDKRPKNSEARQVVFYAIELLYCVDWLMERHKSDYLDMSLDIFPVKWGHTPDCDIKRNIEYLEMLMKDVKVEYLSRTVMAGD